MRNNVISEVHSGQDLLLTFISLYDNVSRSFANNSNISQSFAQSNCFTYCIFASQFQFLRKCNLFEYILPKMQYYKLTKDVHSLPNSTTFGVRITFL